MQISPAAGEVRALVRRTFLELGIGQDRLPELAETLLIDDGQVKARSYRLDELMAMWMIDVGIVQFYDKQGNMLRRMNLFAEIQPRRMAA